MLSVDKAEFIAIWLESLLYGIYFTNFVSSIGLLTWRRSSKRINSRLVLTSLGIFVFATAHLVISFSRGIEAFIDQRDQPGGPVAYYDNLRTALEVSQASTQVAISFLGDIMVIYRVWVVYSRNYWVLVLPFLSLIGTAVSSIASVYYIGRSSSSSNTTFTPKLEIWFPAFFASTFATSILCSVLIAARLWYIRRKVPFGRTIDTLTTVLRIVIESASIYALTMLLYLSTYVRKLNISIVFGDMVAPVIGIAFSLITVRIHNAFNPDKYNTNEYRLNDVERNGHDQQHDEQKQNQNKRYHVTTDNIPDSSRSDSDTGIGHLSDPLSTPFPLSFGNSSGEGTKPFTLTKP